MKIKAYIHAQYNDWEKKYAFHTWQRDMSDVPNCGPLVGTHEFDFEPPPNDVLVNNTIAQYREMQKSILGEAQTKATEIDRKINELLCIEYKEIT